MQNRSTGAPNARRARAFALAGLLIGPALVLASSPIAVGHVLCDVPTLRSVGIGYTSQRGLHDWWALSAPSGAVVTAAPVGGFVQLDVYVQPPNCFWDPGGPICSAYPGGSDSACIVGPGEYYVFVHWYSLGAPWDCWINYPDVDCDLLVPYVVTAAAP